MLAALWWLSFPVLLVFYPLLRLLRVLKLGTTCTPAGVLVEGWPGVGPVLRCRQRERRARMRGAGWYIERFLNDARRRARTYRRGSSIRRIWGMTSNQMNDI